MTTEQILLLALVIWSPFAAIGSHQVSMWLSEYAAERGNKK